MAVNDVASAQKVILGELSTQFGGQALARAKTLSGQMQILANNFGDLFEQGDFGNFAKGVVAALNRIILALPMVISQVRIWINQFDAYMDELALSAVLTGKKIADALGMKDASKVATASLAQIMQDHKATMADMAVAQKNFDDAKKKSMMYEAVMSTDTSNIKIQNTKNESAAKTAAKQTEAEEFTTYDMWLEEQKNELSKASLARFTATQKAHYEINKAFLALESKEYQTYSNFMMNSLNKNNKAEFIAFKAFSIIEATMNTYRAASGAFAFGNKIAGPVLGAVLAASAVAMGLRHVQAIAKMQPPKAAAGGYIPG